MRGKHALPLPLHSHRERSKEGRDKAYRTQQQVDNRETRKKKTTQRPTPQYDEQPGCPADAPTVPRVVTQPCHPQRNTNERSPITETPAHAVLPRRGPPKTPTPFPMRCGGRRATIDTESWHVFWPLRLFLVDGALHPR